MLTRSRPVRARQGVREGHGTLTFANGASFEGTFKAGRRAGRGIHRFRRAAPREAAPRTQDGPAGR